MSDGMMAGHINLESDSGFRCPTFKVTLWGVLNNAI